MSKLPIARTHIAGKRRFVFYLSDIVKHINNLTNDNNPHDKSCREVSVERLRDIVKTVKLRGQQDYIYVPNRDDTALNLSATQALLIIYGDNTASYAEHEAAWTMFHQITDFIQGVK